MKGYWNKPEATAAAVRDGWMKTGDAAYRDEDGYVYIYDRVKDMIVTGGENVYPAEVENAIFGHPDMADVAVIGVPDEKWGESVKAVVVARPGAASDPASVIAWSRERIANYKAPKTVDFVEAIPRNITGKILRREIRKPYWEGRDRMVNLRGALTPCAGAGRRRTRRGRTARGVSAGRWQGSVRRSPSGVMHSVRPPISLASIGTRRTSGLRRSSAAICVFALLGLQRAGAIDDRAARLGQRDRAVDQVGSAAWPRLTMSPGRLVQATSGWRRMVPVALQGASSSAASNGGASKVSALATTSSASSCSRARLTARRFSRCAERSTAETAAPASASCAHLPPGAAQRSTRARPARRQQPRRQRRGGVLHPPFALGIALELGDRRMRVEPDRAGRQARGRPGASAQPSGSLLTLMSSVGSSRWARAIARAVSSP